MSLLLWVLLGCGVSMIGVGVLRHIDNMIMIGAIVGVAALLTLLVLDE